MVTRFVLWAVSILVLLDVALKVAAEEEEEEEWEVSILVLLDVALKAAPIMSASSFFTIVSILVLLDVALKAFYPPVGPRTRREFQSLFSWMLL